MSSLPLGEDDGDLAVVLPAWFKAELKMNHNNSSSNSLNTSLIDFSKWCYEFTEEQHALVENFDFWVAGVIPTGLSVLGIVGNTIASVIITRKEMRNSFNLLLVSLACYDSLYLVSYLLECIR